MSESEKWHITSKGVPGKCEAGIRNCPRGGSHFDNEAEALGHLSQLNESKHGLTSKITRAKNALRNAISGNIKESGKQITFESRKEFEEHPYNDAQMLEKHGKYAIVENDGTVTYRMINESGCITTVQKAPDGSKRVYREESYSMKRSLTGSRDDDGREIFEVKGSGSFERSVPGDRRIIYRELDGRTSEKYSLGDSIVTERKKDGKLNDHKGKPALSSTYKRNGTLVTEETHYHKGNKINLDSNGLEDYTSVKKENGTTGRYRESAETRFNSNQKLHSTSGPAVFRKQVDSYTGEERVTNEAYYINGQKMTKENFYKFNTSEATQKVFKNVGFGYRKEYDNHSPEEHDSEMRVRDISGDETLSNNPNPKDGEKLVHRSSYVNTEIYKNKNGAIVTVKKTPSGKLHNLGGAAIQTEYSEKTPYGYYQKSEKYYYADGQQKSLKTENGLEDGHTKESTETEIFGIGRSNSVTTKTDSYGALHSLDGPSIMVEEFNGGEVENAYDHYYIHGKKMTKEEHSSYVSGLREKYKRSEEVKIKEEEMLNEMYENGYDGW